MKRIMILISIIEFLLGTTVWAGSLTVPNTFISGQKALASEVNANFKAVKTEVDDNAADISKNAADIHSNTNSITQNAAEISSNVASITTIDGNLDDKVNALTCGNGQVLKYNAATADYECADDLDTPITNALTLEGRPASDFADSVHSHARTNFVYSAYLPTSAISVGQNRIIQFPVPNDLKSGGDIEIELLLRKDEAIISPGQVVFYIEITEISVGDVLNETPSVVGLPQTISVSGEFGNTVYAVNWSTTIGVCDLLRLNIIRNSYGGLTDNLSAFLVPLTIKISQFTN